MDLTVAGWGYARWRFWPRSTAAARWLPCRPDGRWAACNTYPDEAAETRSEAERRLRKLLKRGRRGLVAEARTLLRE